MGKVRVYENIYLKLIVYSRWSILFRLSVFNFITVYIITSVVYNGSDKLCQLCWRMGPSSSSRALCPATELSREFEYQSRCETQILSRGCRVPEKSLRNNRGRVDLWNKHKELTMKIVISSRIFNTIGILMDFATWVVEEKYEEKWQIINPSRVMDTKDWNHQDPQSRSLGQLGELITFPSRSIQ